MNLGELPREINTPEGRVWLLEILHKSPDPVFVTFTKSDGSERVMKCTLNDKYVVPYERKTDAEKKPRDGDIIPVWDLDNTAWRSFKLSTVTTVEFAMDEDQDGV